jgi:hypothetical protein
MMINLSNVMASRACRRGAYDDPGTVDRHDPRLLCSGSRDKHCGSKHGDITGSQQQAKGISISIE